MAVELEISPCTMTPQKRFTRARPPPQPELDSVREKVSPQYIYYALHQYFPPFPGYVITFGLWKRLRISVRMRLVGPRRRLVQKRSKPSAFALSAQRAWNRSAASWCARFVDIICPARIITEYFGLICRIVD
jgi:hypothetical protein